MGIEPTVVFTLDEGSQQTHMRRGVGLLGDTGHPYKLGDLAASALLRRQGHFVKGPQSRSSGKRLWAQLEVRGGEPAAFEAGSWGLCNAASKESEAVFLARREQKGIKEGKLG